MLTGAEAREMGPYAPVIVEKLQFWAQCMAARFAAPVRLVGSALHSPEPRDIDIRIVIPDAQFCGRYGKTREEWESTDRGQRWIDDMAKMNRFIAEKHRENIDVQVWPQSVWLEPYPAPIVLADLSPRWWIGPVADAEDLLSSRIVAEKAGLFSPVDQEPGGCWVACLASITGIPLAEFPKAPDYDTLPDEEWGAARCNYHNGSMAVLHRHGWTVTNLGSRVPVEGYAIASGPSPRNTEIDVERGRYVWHATVWKDNGFLFDPHPSRGCLGGREPEDFELVVRIRPFEKAAA